MFTVSLAPTSAPSRWYSKPLGIQDEYKELAFLEAKFVHERDQALEVHCQVVYPVTSSNNNSEEDPSTDEVAIQDDSHDRGLASTELDASLDDRLEAPDFDTPDRRHGELLDYLQHGEQYNQNNVSGHQYVNTPGQMNDYYTTPDNSNYVSPPPPASRSLRQYLDDSSRGFMEPMEMIDHMAPFDDNDTGSYGDAEPIHEDAYYQQPDMESHDLSSPSTRRSNFFD